MKVTRVDTEKSCFKPITVQVVIESEEELEYLKDGNYSLCCCTLETDVSEATADYLVTLIETIYEEATGE